MRMSKDIQELLQVPTTKTVDCILCVGCGVGGVGGGIKDGGRCTSRGGCEMPRPCLRDDEQAQGNPRFSKRSLT